VSELGALDSLDGQILELLKKDGRLPWSEVGARLHLTGQAVGLRVARMMRVGIIEGFGVRTRDLSHAGLTAFANVTMSTADHLAFERFLESRSDIASAHKTSGAGCYLIEVRTTNQESLDRLLTEVLEFGNYSLSISIRRVR
jgi:Lrp/AsnC family transcriptional regulator, leucine-responsive regulatory protein